MRASLLLLPLLLAFSVLAVPAAPAHEVSCALGSGKCVVDCLAHLAPGWAHSCTYGGVEVFSSYQCPWGSSGASLTVLGVPVLTCSSLP